MILFDTNILVYSQNKKDPRYKICQDWIKKSENQDIQGVISSQNLVEFVSVFINLSKLTRQTKQKDVIKSLDSFQSGILKIIYPTFQTISIFNQLLLKNQTTRKKVFDLFLLATMLSNGVKQILTYNSKDYSQFPQIQTIIPS